MRSSRPWSWSRACTFALTLGLTAPLHAQEESFDAITPLVQESRFRAALERADTFQDPVLASQSRLWILYSAGDLRGGLAAGLVGLEVAPEEPWLLEQAADLAGILAAPELMDHLVSRLEQVPAAPAERVSALRERADELLASAAARSALMSRAKATVLGFAVFSLLALVSLASAGGPKSAKGV